MSRKSRLYVSILLLVCLYNLQGTSSRFPHASLLNMSHLDMMGCKKRKRGERVFRFKTFGENGYPIEFDGSFLENVKALLELGQSESSSCIGVPCWSFELEINRQPPLHVLLYVIEEPIEASLSHHCKHCLYVGNTLKNSILVSYIPEYVIKWTRINGRKFWKPPKIRKIIGFITIMNCTRDPHNL